MSVDLQSRYVNIKCNISKTGLTPEMVVAWVQHPKDGTCDEYGNDWGGWPAAEIFWAVHDEPGKELHFHMVIRFPSVTRWGRLRDYLTFKDKHHYSQPAKAFNRSVRYLLHLDNSEKVPIPRENLKTTKNVDDSELSQLLGAPRTCILNDIRNIPSNHTFTAFDYLVNVRGHSPNEVTQVLRCLMAISDWTKKILEDDAIRREIALSELASLDPFKEEDDFTQQTFDL